MILIYSDYWLFVYLSISRIIIKSPAQYAKVFVYSEIDENDLTYFIKYKLDKIDLAFIHLKNYIDRKMKEKEDSMIFLKFKGVTERQAQILGFYKNDKNRYFSVLVLANKFEITKQTARVDLKNLVKLIF